MTIDTIYGYVVGDTHGLVNLHSTIDKMFLDGVFHDGRANKRDYPVNIYHVGDVGIGFHGYDEDPYEYLMNDKSEDALILRDLNMFLKKHNANLYLVRGNHDNPVYWKDSATYFSSDTKTMPEDHGFWKLIDVYDRIMFLPDRFIVTTPSTTFFKEKYLSDHGFQAPDPGYDYHYTLFHGGALSLNRKYLKTQGRVQRRHMYWEDENVPIIPIDGHIENRVLNDRNSILNGNRLKPYSLKTHVNTTLDALPILTCIAHEVPHKPYSEFEMENDFVKEFCHRDYHLRSDLEHFREVIEGLLGDIYLFNQRSMFPHASVTWYHGHYHKYTWNHHKPEGDSVQLVTHGMAIGQYQRIY